MVVSLKNPTGDTRCVKGEQLRAPAEMRIHGWDQYTFKTVFSKYSKIEEILQNFTNFKKIVFRWRVRVDKKAGNIFGWLYLYRKQNIFNYWRRQKCFPTARSWRYVITEFLLRKLFWKFKNLFLQKKIFFLDCGGITKRDEKYTLRKGRQAKSSRNGEDSWVRAIETIEVYAGWIVDVCLEI